MSRGTTKELAGTDRNRQEPVGLVDHGTKLSDPTVIKIKEDGSLILCSTSSGGTSNKNRVDLGTILGSSGPRGSLEGPRGTENARNFLGASLERPGDALGVVLEVWGDPWVSPGKAECCYVVAFRCFSEMSCFFMFFFINI